MNPKIREKLGKCQLSYLGLVYKIDVNLLYDYPKIFLYDYPEITNLAILTKEAMVITSFVKTTFNYEEAIIVEGASGNIDPSFEFLNFKKFNPNDSLENFALTVEGTNRRTLLEFIIDCGEQNLSKEDFYELTELLNEKQAPLLKKNAAKIVELFEKWS